MTFILLCEVKSVYFMSGKSTKSKLYGIPDRFEKIRFEVKQILNASKEF